VDVRYAVYPPPDDQENLEWQTPGQQDHICVLASGDESVLREREQESYLLVTPGVELLRQQVKKRKEIRREDLEESEWEDMMRGDGVPDRVLIDWCQGFAPELGDDGHGGGDGGGGKKEFMWLVEWEFTLLGD
jgi:hypothetical protein